MSIKAIETHYKGYRFRSRLEARWAVYFDALGLKWEYELEGFELPSGRYLPDFWLPQVKSWAEVKPVELSEKEIAKAQELVLLTGKDCILLVGTPDGKPYDVVTSTGERAYVTDCAISMYHGYPICESRFYQSGVDIEDFRLNGGLFDDVWPAVSAARSARFEFNR